MKDIGSIFPLYKEDLQYSRQLFECKDNFYLLSLCREALSVIAEHESLSDKKVLLPAYTCGTVITPFIEKGWKCYYYSINKDLTIDTGSVLTLADSLRPTLFLSHPYYGMDLTYKEVGILEKLHDKGIKLIVDLTQCIYSSQHLDFVDYYVGSYRKWYNVPDGGFLRSKKKMNFAHNEENITFLQQQIDAMYLRGAYFDTGDEEIKQISIRMNKAANASIESDISPHSISDISYRILTHLNHDSFSKQRMTNYKYLHEKLSRNFSIELVCKDMSRLTTAPLYFAIYSSNRVELQKILAANHIYVPIIWPVYYHDVVINATTKEIYDTILAIPIDQRYDENDMKRITELINNFQN